MRKTDPIANAQVYAQHERVDWTWRSVLYRTLYRPVEMLATEPILLLITLYMGLVYAILYACPYFSPRAIDTHLPALLQYWKQSR